MNALTIFIRRPVLATMVTVLLLVLGVFSLRTLGVDLNPKVEIPYVNVMTSLRGASPEEIESQVTKPIEEAVNTVSGIDELHSYSREGLSIVVIGFKLERSADAAAQDVRDKVSAALRNLPTGTDAPIVARFDLDAVPVMTLAISGNREMKEVSEVTRLRVKEALENVSGVGSVDIVGAEKRAVNVVLDVDRLQAYGLPISMVKAALISQNIEIPSGRIDRGENEQVLRTLARVEKVEDFNRLVVATMDGRQITLGDLGHVEDSVEESRSRSRVWHAGDKGLGQQAVSLNVVKQSGSNTVEVIKAVKARLEEIKPTLPPGFNVSIISDQSVFIDESIHELLLHLVLGGVLAALAVLVFMKNVRSTLIAAIAIPTSLVATFALMKAMDFTLNNMTLLGLTLAVGIVIDDAIVVLENIFRHMEQYGKSAWDASIDGLKEIGLAVMATTTSLMVIFLPIAFMDGMVGRFLHEFGITVAFAIGVSLLISFTLTPMLSARILKVIHHKRKKPKKHEHGLLERIYGKTIEWGLRFRWAVVLIAIGCFMMLFVIAPRLGTDFIPQDDRSEFQVSIITPGGSSLQASDKYFSAIEDALHKIPGIETTQTQIGSTTAGSETVTQGTIYVALTDLKKRSWSQANKMKEVREVLSKWPELKTSVNFLGMMGGGSRLAQFQFNIVGFESTELSRISNDLANQLRQSPGFVDVDTSLATLQPEVQIHLNRQKAADLQISATDIASTLRTMVGGEPVTKFKEGIEQYDVWLRLDKQNRSDVDLINTLPLVSSSPNAKSGLVPLAQIANMGNGNSPDEIQRFNRQRMVTVFANLDGIDLGNANKVAVQKLADMKLPPGYGQAQTGTTKMMKESMINMAVALLLSFVFMYIVLAAQFESFLHPVTILLSLPLTLPFAMFSLWVMHDTINIYSMLGIFMLFGIVKKNGILQIDYTNTLYAQGMPLHEAIIEANKARLRPILMTTVTLIAGMTPIALGQGPGAAARSSLAKVIIGGQALSLFITLLIVPVAYSIFEGIKKWMGVGKEKKKDVVPELPPLEDRAPESPTGSA